ncbi:M56 family metallopeptidase [Micromonospora peucetia]|uniref:BlaR1 peptidase M56 n=1 Tax=Micromonospora peucetia TaxID=47871 RepID=A0A1C6V0D9_9ACTN|nr:M56 family metallopeptidase [Micromonospora peucetia]MCX4391307.1 M56 family metallopeptidase [Micromonospora peucetia]WSA35140.1 M56 family metallopeptidase [Micromonospora peucetia]SCL59677.1 BlaR1 peptidase M56 [Micromonospora peucetia]
MSPAFPLIAGALAVAWLAPTLLERAAGRVRDPIAVLLAWWGSLAAVLLTFVAGLVLLLAPAGRIENWAEHLARHCWLAVRHGRLPAQDKVVGVIGVAAVAVLVARCLVVAVRQWRSQRRSRQAHQDLVTLVGETLTPERQPVLRVPHRTPLAYSVGGRRGLLVVSAGVLRLPPAQRAAVLCHERAHLRGRHHLIVAFAEVLAKTAPWVPLTRRAPRAIRLLVELSADAAAVRACGAPAVRAALIALDGAPHPAHTLPMAGTDVSTRLHRLQAGPPGYRTSARVALPLAAVFAPGLVSVVGAIICCV